MATKILHGIATFIGAVLICVFVGVIFAGILVLMVHAIR